MKLSVNMFRFFSAKKAVIVLAIFVVWAAPAVLTVRAATNEDINQNDKNIFDARVDTTNASLAVKVAPGELLPVSVKLLNFGRVGKVDVLVTYGIFDTAGKKIYSMNETVAVETTASFIRTIQIPFDTPPGVYNARTSILYKDQLVPATTQFEFTVERKIFGVFQSDFILYGGIAVLAAVVLLFLGTFLVRRQKTTRLDPLNYADVPADQRIFYELLSDSIMQMRLKVGDVALEIAKSVNGLTVDEKTGRILKITETPSKVIADLVAGYEKVLGEKVNFSFRKK